MSDPSNAAGSQQPNEVSKSEVYRALIAVYLQRDTLSWSRTQALGVVEIAAVTASFATHHRGWAIAALVVGGSFIFLIWSLIKRDWECRDHVLKNPVVETAHNSLNINFRPDPDPKWQCGKVIMRWIVWGLIGLNGVLGVLFCCGIPVRRQTQDFRAIEIRTPGKASLTYPIEPDKNITIEFDGTNFNFWAEKP